MGNSEDDDDTHFCIKCHSTITGLQNYVNHRTAKCQTRLNATNDVGKSDAVEDNYFFSSLCLKSTTSHAGSVVPTPSSSASSSKPITVGITTRSKIGVPKNKPKEGAEKNKRNESEFDAGETAFADELQENAVVQSYLAEPPGLGIDENESTDESDEETAGRWMNSLWPPPSHTGGKWKPAGSPDEEPAQRMLMPPPDHTQGKWAPNERDVPARKTHYWCSPCDRRLSSKLSYSKHVKSKFHLKRTNAINQTPRLTEKRNRRPSRKMLEASDKLVNNKLKGKRMRNPRGPVICPACRYKVWPHLMGKHLVSHYHCRRPGDKATSDALVLKEMGSIVRQAPFQCGMCKFYCNSNEAFMSHWHSEMHLQKDKEVNGTYLCGFCSFKTVSTLEMGEHLIGESHSSIMAIINNSMPIVIYRRIPLKCFVCQETFRFNAQIRHHARITNHVQLQGTASDDYQELIACGFCSNVSHSKVAHQRHLRVKHNALEYFCRPCNLKFSSSEAARRHRKTAIHLDVTSRKQKRCMHCSRPCVNMGELKKHIEAVHPERKSSCEKCGASFPLKQMLSRHVKEGKCPGLPQNSPIRTSDGKLSCSACSFSCDNRSDLLTHAILHGQASHCGSYECPKCHQRVKKEQLRRHVKKHRLETNEFDDWPRLTERLKENHVVASPEGRERPYKCPDCEARFYERAVLNRHCQIHRGKKLQCDHPDCIFTARSNWELANHVRTHSVDRTFHCQYCSYSSKTKAQLAKHIKGMHLVGVMKECPHCDFTTQHSTHMRRHLRIHSGAKPYKCPYCNYACNLLENLRKHVVNSKKHPNKSVFECKKEGCDFGCNRSQEYKIHLVQEHGEDKTVAASFVAGLYRPEQDITVSAGQIIESKRRKKPREHTASTSVELVVAGDDDEEPTILVTAPDEEKRGSSVFIEVDVDEYSPQVHAYGEEFIIDDSFDDEIEITGAPPT